MDGVTSVLEGFNTLGTHRSVYLMTMSRFHVHLWLVWWHRVCGTHVRGFGENPSPRKFRVYVYRYTHVLTLIIWRVSHRPNLPMTTSTKKSFCKGAPLEHIKANKLKSTLVRKHIRFLPFLRVFSIGEWWLHHSSEHGM